MEPIINTMQDLVAYNIREYVSDDGPGPHVIIWNNNDEWMRGKLALSEFELAVPVGRDMKTASISVARSNDLAVPTNVFQIRALSEQEWEVKVCHILHKTLANPRRNADGELETFDNTKLADGRNRMYPQLKIDGNIVNTKAFMTESDQTITLTGNTTIEIVMGKDHVIKTTWVFPIAAEIPEQQTLLNDEAEPDFPQTQLNNEAEEEEESDTPTGAEADDIVAAKEASLASLAKETKDAKDAKQRIQNKRIAEGRFLDLTNDSDDNAKKRKAPDQKKSADESDDDDFDPVKNRRKVVDSDLSSEQSSEEESSEEESSDEESSDEEAPAAKNVKPIPKIATATKKIAQPVTKKAKSAPSAKGAPSAKFDIVKILKNENPPIEYMNQEWENYEPTAKMYIKTLYWALNPGVQKILDKAIKQNWKLLKGNDKRQFKLAVYNNFLEKEVYEKNPGMQQNLEVGVNSLNTAMKMAK
jgi:hypothetical protein